MKNTRVTGSKLSTVAMVVLSLVVVVLTGCDLLGAGSIDPEVLRTGGFVPALPAEDSGDDAAAPAEDSGDDAAAPAEDSGDDAAAPAEDNGDDAAAPAEDSGDDAAAPAEDNGDDAAAPAEDNGDDAAAPAENNGNAGALSTDPANPTIWNAQQIYAQQGYYVSHNSNTYESQWWVQGAEPGAAEWNGWREVNSDGSYVVYIRPGQENTSDWSETVAYPGANYYVRYNGLEYRSKWYANAGETPGVAAVWERVE